MELFRTQQYYILLNRLSTLWIDRTTGQLDAKPAWELANGQDIECLGVFHGLVGRVRYNKVDRFILIRDSVLVGTIPIGNEVYKIKSIVLLNPTIDNIDDLGLQVCAKHNYEDFLSLSVTPETSSSGNSAFARAWGNVKSATLNQLKPSNFQTSPQAKGPSLNYKDGSNLSKTERRIEEEILRIFTDSDSFYYCPDNRGDITNAVPRQGGELDDRFFWNKHMLRDIIELGSDHAKAWINPIIQGYVEIAPIRGLDLSLILISRRSRFRAGTRYKRRGLNPEGHCANYVETEQIISFKSHAVSFLMVRGSVPLYWSQPGIKYRPAPILHKSFTENQAAFEKHFDNQLSLYEKVIVVNLVEQLGKESIIFNAYTQHVLSLNNEQVVYVTFDFHEYCRGMHFERVSLLVDKLKSESVFREMSYSWKDKQGLICEQKSVFRVNCIDCLDRTNVVQTALAKTVLIKQLNKLGIVSPEGDLPKNMASKFQVMWANNGDIISKQYAGTAALKGDFTRTGDRKLTGLMKDGMTSANRYYLSRFKDNTRQMCLDIMCGELENTTEEETMSDEDNEDEDEEMQTSEEEDKSNVQHIKTLIEDCKRLMLTDDEHVINAWPLLAYEDQTIGLSSEDFDRILILTKDMLKIAEYNVHLDNMALLVCTPLRHVHAICLGPLNKSTSSTPVSHTNSNSTLLSTKPKRLYLKLILAPPSNGERQELVLTSSRIHYFNNQVSIVRSIDEKNEALRAVGESIQICMRLCECPIDVQYGPIDLKSRDKGGNLVVSNVMSLIKKHRKTSDVGVTVLSQPIQMEMGKEAVESYMPNIGIIRSNVSIEELDLNDILIDDNIDIHSTSITNTDLSYPHAHQSSESLPKNLHYPHSDDSSHAHQSSESLSKNLHYPHSDDSSHAHQSSESLSKNLRYPHSDDSSHAHQSYPHSDDSSRVHQSSESKKVHHPYPDDSSLCNMLHMQYMKTNSDTCSRERIDNDVRLEEENKDVRLAEESKEQEFNNNNNVMENKSGTTKPSDVGTTEDFLNKERQVCTEERSSMNIERSGMNNQRLAETPNNRSQKTSNLGELSDQGGSQNTPTSNELFTEGSVANSFKPNTTQSGLEGSVVQNLKSSVLVKLNSCDIQDNIPFSKTNTETMKKSSHLTLDLIGSPLGTSYENLSTLKSPESTKLVKSSSEKDLLLTNTIKQSQSDNSSLRQNIRSAIVSPTNVLSKFVTKGVANLNSLDPRRRLSMTNQKMAGGVNSPGGQGGGSSPGVQEAREKLEERWKRYGCKSKLIAL